MKLKIKKCGGEIEIEGKLKSLIQQASLIQSIPDTCPLCGGPIRFDYREPKGYTYYSLRCMKCNATKNFGTKKETGTLFLRHDENFEVYRGSDRQNNNPNTGSDRPNNNTGVKPDDSEPAQDDMPF